ncbi:MAG: aldehyde dehydrogenase [Clostridia bacterium]|nr:aldehyde dehydrogenase [Clostridia bacterium]
MQTNVKELISAQRAFFQSGKTLSVDFRIEALKKLSKVVQEHEKEICKALQADLGKSAAESYMCEVGMALSEICYMFKHVKKWSKGRKVRTPLAQFASKSYQKPSPYGNALIMSPWNYPFLLTVDPIANAIAAGNTAIVKPSAYAPATSAVLESLISKTFPKEYIAVVMGGRKENAALLDEKFDIVFFTGSQAVGKEVLRKCAEHLTPAVLELGGKSPCIVDETAKIPLAAKRIVFGKFLNCGQTCVAPDYILCQSTVKDELTAEIKKQIKLQYGEKPLENENYGKIVNEKHFERLVELMEREKILYGGGVSALKQKIEPTVLGEVTWEDPVMREEIFGPILPILTFENFEELYPLLQNKEKPLALYLFTEDKRRARAAMEKFAFGGGCINDTIIHLATSEMGFGGVGESGMGAYHGKTGFDAFSHYKSIVEKGTKIDLPMRYQPYKKSKEKLIRKFLK